MACEFGSRVKPGLTSSWEWVTGQALADAAGVLSQYFAGPIIRQLFPRLVDLTVLCAAPPPPLPTIDLRELALAGNLPQLPPLVLDWLMANWARSNWNTFCECAPSPPPPSGVWVQLGCVNIECAPDAEGFLRHYNGPYVPNGATRLRVQWTSGDTDAASPNARLWNTDPTGTPNCSTTMPPTGDFDTIALVKGTWYEFQNFAQLHVTQPSVWTSIAFTRTSGTTDQFCWEYQGGSGPPPTPFSPAPPPPPLDPPTGCTLDDVCEQLDALRLALLPLAEQVSIIRRYETPFRYRVGVTQLQVSLKGSMNVSRPLGMRVHVTAYPTGNRTMEGNPTYVWDLGWLSISSPGGMLIEKRLSQLDFDWFPEQMPLATAFSWDLFPGVVANITPLLI